MGAVVASFPCRNTRWYRRPRRVERPPDPRAREEAARTRCTRVRSALARSHTRRAASARAPTLVRSRRSAPSRSRALLLRTTRIGARAGARPRRPLRAAARPPERRDGRAGGREMRAIYGQVAAPFASWQLELQQPPAAPFIAP